jgi:hypothetical protein
MREELECLGKDVQLPKQKVEKYINHSMNINKNTLQSTLSSQKKDAT